MSEVKVFVKELNREVVIVESTDCPCDPYSGDFYCYDAEEIKELYEQNKVHFGEYEMHFFLFDSMLDEVVVATCKEVE